MFHTYYFYIALLPSIILHEVSHGWVANLFGDPTAKNAKRLSLNPARHVDPFGTILLPALLIALHFPPFGYAKPVPVNTSRLRKPRQQSLYVSLAGPAVNIVLSAVGLLLCDESGVHFINGVPHYNDVLFNVGVALGVSNLLLAAFNLLPIPPLDGSAIIERFVPNRHLGTYYHWRARALPLVLAFVILSEYVFHFGSNALSGLENWWFSLISVR
ncbi:MAG: site-2 protease family protein [Acidimicrobiales bacterium]|jgi:Zn-dependent protease